MNKGYIFTSAFLSIGSRSNRNGVWFIVILIGMVCGFSEIYGFDRNVVVTENQLRNVDRNQTDKDNLRKRVRGT